MRCKIHKYARGRLGNKVIYRCLNCPSYLFDRLVVGHQSLCHGCGDPFIIGKVLQAKPHCGCLTSLYKKKYKLETRIKKPIQPEIRNELLDMLESKLK